MAATKKAPLGRFSIVGVTTNWYSAAPGHKQPGGSCWHCGQGIAIEVLCLDSETGERVTVGTTCAERVGLDAEQLHEMLQERYAEERAERMRQRSEEYRAKMAEEEAAAVAFFGEHGTESRFLSGCYCDRCVTAAPHGTMFRFREGCRCVECVGFMLTTERWYVRDDDTVLVDLGTGRVVPDARAVDTTYGMRWRSDSLDVWLPWLPKRRTTLANKGFTEAEVPVLCERRGTRSRSWSSRDIPMASPLVDRFGEPIPQETGRKP